MAEFDHHDEPAPVREGLELFFKHLGAPPVDVVSGLTASWPEIVGPALAGPTWPIELIDGVLAVGCEDPAWASQIGWMEGQIKDRFTELFPSIVLKRVTTRNVR